MRPDRPAWAQGPEWAAWTPLSPHSVATHAVGFDWLIQQAEGAECVILTCCRFGYSSTSRRETPSDALEHFHENVCFAEQREVSDDA